MMQSAFERLRELSTLETNWDSYGAAPISREALEAARGLLIALAGPCNIAPIAYGGLQLEWSGPLADLEVEIDTIGNVHIDDRSFTEQQQ